MYTLCIPNQQYMFWCSTCVHIGMCTAVFIINSTRAGVQHAVYTFHAHTHVCTCVFLINSSICAGVHHVVFLNNSFVFVCCVHIGRVHMYL